MLIASSFDQMEVDNFQDTRLCFASINGSSQLPRLLCIALLSDCIIFKILKEVDNFQDSSLLQWLYHYCKEV